ncbi:MAG: transglycosylase SLT domain-containing protein [Flavobacteriales bacterium]|nr:transglycosylase SLT domain-containing protein [Flavobacteriales bacterium]
MKKAVFLLLLFVFQGFNKKIFVSEDINSSDISSLTTEVLDSINFKVNNDDPVMMALDSLVTSPYFKKFGYYKDTSIQESFYNRRDSIPKTSDAEIRARLARLNEKSPFNLVYNKETKAFIDLYSNKMRWSTAKIMGLSQTYFPMFEDILDKYELPLEFKYLAVVESALNPRAKSYVGAVGLWQFMYNTGKMFDLNITSYLDERKDPYKSTEAACKYFIYLYNLYGDWDLVMAAYNCGPGNVNKAIRRSGQSRNYWKLWPYLPKETRGYVPAFIAANYVLNYAEEHNIHPIQPDLTFFETDTIHVTQKVDLLEVSERLDLSIEFLEMINPTYKLNIIPKDGKKHILYLPYESVGLFIENEEAIYQVCKSGNMIQNPSEAPVEEQIEVKHLVESGENIIDVAKRYRCLVRDLKKWNKLKDGYKISEGQELQVFVSASVLESIKAEEEQPDTDNTESNS